MVFSKRNRKHYSVFLSSYRNTRESLGEIKKAGKHSPVARVPTAFLVLPNFHPHSTCFLLLKYLPFCPIGKGLGRLSVIVHAKNKNKSCSRIQANFESSLSKRQGGVQVSFEHGINIQYPVTFCI